MGALVGRFCVKNFSSRRQLKKVERKEVVLRIVLTLLYTVFIFRTNFLKTKPVLIAWFLILGIVIITGLYRYTRHFKNSSPLTGWKSLEFLLPLLLLIESLIQFLGKPLFHLAYIPFIVIISGYLSHKIVLSCMAAIFLLGTPTLWWLNGIFTEEGSIYLSILVTGIISYGILYNKIKKSKKALEDLETLKASA